MITKWCWLSWCKQHEDWSEKRLVEFTNCKVINCQSLDKKNFGLKKYQVPFTIM